MLQWVLTSSGLIDGMARSTASWLSAAILLGAGLYQFSALKTACLSKCRSTLAYFMAQWRDGAAGALRLGLGHGGICVSCCWALMAVMFVVGAMNLVWMGLFTLVVLGEKLMPPAWRFDRIVGMTLIASGLWIGVGAGHRWALGSGHRLVGYPCTRPRCPLRCLAAPRAPLPPPV